MNTNVGLTTKFLKGWRAIGGDSALPIGALEQGPGISISGKTIRVTGVDGVAGTYANPILTIDETGRVMDVQEGSTPGLIPTDTLPDLAALEAYSGSAEYLLVLDAGDGRTGIYILSEGEYVGPAYITGPAGQDGSDGEDGSEGPQGPIGLEGQRGADGLQGIPGVQGERGQQGANGAQGVPGQQGVEGPMGPIGATLLPDEYGNIDEDAIARIQAQAVRRFFLVNPAGDLRTNKATPSGISGDMSLHLVGYSPVTGWTDYGQLTGAQGPRGLQGIQGVQGQPGVAGIQGPAGVAGSVGAEGPRGLQGISGPAGVAGPAGANGTNGDAGPQGERGLQGIQGIQGVAGVNGVQGEQGIRGENGFVWNARNVSQAGTTVGAESSGYTLFLIDSANTITVSPLSGSQYVDISNSLSTNVVVTRASSTRTLLPGEVVRFYGNTGSFTLRRSEYPAFRGVMYSASSSAVATGNNINVATPNLVYNSTSLNFRPAGTPTSQIIIPAGVSFVRISAGICFSSGAFPAAVNVYFSLLKNGSGTFDGGASIVGQTLYTNSRFTCISGVVQVSAGDVITTSYSSNSTTAKTATEGTYLSIEILG